MRTGLTKQEKTTDIWFDEKYVSGTTDKLIMEGGGKFRHPLRHGFIINMFEYNTNLETNVKIPNIEYSYISDELSILGYKEIKGKT